MNCPLCHTNKVVDYYQDKRRPYLNCTICELVFVPPQFHLSAQLEKAEYDKHENHLDDQGYIHFLSRMITPMSERIKKNSSGIDIGSGEAPALAKQMEKLGHTMAVYDLYYHPERQVLNDRYDFVTCTEVIEHIAQPVPFLKQLLSLLKPKAYLGFMTKLVIDKERFANWHYKNDPTHICFYSQATFEYIAKQYQMNLEIIGSDVIILQPKDAIS